MKKRLRPIWVGIALLGLLSACGGAGPETEDGREQVTIALWSDQLTENYTQYIQETFPEVDFTFYAATNSTDFYRFKEETGYLPDILTVRRFALRDVEDWRDSLMDLSDTDLVSAFPQSYLRSYTYDDGTVNWIPACAEVDGLIANRKLIEGCGLSLPENYQEFVELCAALQEAGIRPVRSNFEADYTCMELLQGLSAELLTSQAGREWRQQYESGQTDQLSEEVWMPVFQRMEDFLSYTQMEAEDINQDHAEILKIFQNGDAAMMRGTGNEEAIRKSADGEYVLLPYFGETENWYLTYPAFQVAASVRAEERPERRELILSVMAAMLNQEGQEKIASGQNMIPYSKDIELELSPELANMLPYIEDNRLYIRLASADMFSVSRQVVQGMITQEYRDAREAFDAFNAALRSQEEDAPAAARVGTGYPYAFQAEGGSPAASAVMNSLREELGARLLVGQSVNTAGDIAAGDYTLKELQFLTMGESTELLLCEMTGEQLYRYVDYLLQTPGRRGSVSNDSTLYVSSGFEMEVKKTGEGYTLERLTIDGQELDREQTWPVAVLGSESMMQKDALASAGVTEYERAEKSFQQLIADRLAEGKPLAGPTGYITLH